MIKKYTSSVDKPKIKPEGYSVPKVKSADVKKPCLFESKVNPYKAK